MNLTATLASSLCTNADEQSAPLNDLTSSKYLKTACIITVASNQKEANDYCVAGKMKLFQIDSAAIQDALFDLLRPTYKGTPTIFRVDGIRDPTDDKWYYYSNGKAPAFAGLSWLQTSDTYQPYYTLMVANMAYPAIKVLDTFKCDGIDADSKWNFICEFK